MLVAASLAPLARNGAATATATATSKKAAREEDTRENEKLKRKKEELKESVQREKRLANGLRKSLKRLKCNQAQLRRLDKDSSAAAATPTGHNRAAAATQTTIEVDQAPLSVGCFRFAIATDLADFPRLF